MWRWAWALALLALGSGVPGGAGRGGLHLPTPGGRGRVVTETPRDYRELLRRFPGLALLPRDPRDGDPRDGEPRGGDPRDGEPRDGEPRGGDPWDKELVTEVQEQPVAVVAEEQLQHFGNLEEEPKVIGYFQGQHSERFRSFVAAAQHFQPSVSFFATFDNRAAQRLRLRLNQIDLYPPFQELPRTLGGGPGDTPTIVAFVEQNKRAALRKLKPQTVHEAWEDAMDGIHVVAFAEGDDPDGFEFLEILKDVARDNADNPQLRILWIDPDDFPLLVPFWEEIFDLDLSRPQLGVLNRTDAGSVWLEMEEEDLPGPGDIQEWLRGVLGGLIGPGGDNGDDDDEYDEDDDEEDEDDDEEDDDEDDDDDDDEDDDD